MNREPRRLPRATVRIRSGRKMLRHGLRQGWRLTCGRKFPVVTRQLVTAAKDPGGDR